MICLQTVSDITQENERIEVTQDARHPYCRVPARRGLQRTARAVTRHRGRDPLVRPQVDYPTFTALIFWEAALRLISRWSPLRPAGEVDLLETPPPWHAGDNIKVLLYTEPAFDL